MLNIAFAATLALALPASHVVAPAHAAAHVAVVQQRTQLVHELVGAPERSSVFPTASLLAERGMANSKKVKGEQVGGRVQGVIASKPCPDEFSKEMSLGSGKSGAQVSKACAAQLNQRKAQAKQAAYLERKRAAEAAEAEAAGPAFGLKLPELALPSLPSLPF